MSMPNSAQLAITVEKWLSRNSRGLWEMSREHAVGAQAFHLVVYRARNHVAGREFSALVEVLHEALPVWQQQPAALTANSFRDEERFGPGVVQAGGMELVELEVGHPAAARHAMAMPSPLAPSGLLV